MNTKSTRLLLPLGGLMAGLIRWEVMAEVARAGAYAGQGEEPSTPMPELNEKAAGPELIFKAPAIEGAYRLFLYVTDGHGNGATANLPFHVRQ